MAIRNFRAGGFVTDTPSDIKCFQCGPSSGQYDTIIRNGTQYQVPSGKTLYITRVIINSSSAGGARIADADASVSNSATPPSGLRAIAQTIGCPGSYQPTAVDVFIPIGENKYPLVAAIGASVDVTLFGYEV